VNIIQRPATHSSVFDNRPIVGAVLHGTESHGDITTFQSAGGWHYTVQRSGTIHADVALERAAWRVRASDRWRPVWVLPGPGKITSDVNYCTVGIELITDQGWRDVGEPFSAAQYTALRELVPYLDDRFAPGGGLPWVGHGELQLDRSDPVAFDWTRAGFGDRGPAGRYFDGIPEAPDMTPEQQTILDAAARQTAAGNTIANGGDLDWWIGTWHQLAADKESLAQLLVKAQGERDAQAAEVARLMALPPPTAEPVTVKSAIITLSTGRAVALTR